MSVDSDIAVLEYRDDLGNWEPLAYIGPDRAEGVIDEYGSSTYRGCDLRIRYLVRSDRDD